MHLTNAQHHDLQALAIQAEDLARGVRHVLDQLNQQAEDIPEYPTRAAARDDAATAYILAAAPREHSEPTRPREEVPLGESKTLWASLLSARARKNEVPETFRGPNYRATTTTVFDPASIAGLSSTQRRLFPRQQTALQDALKRARTTDVPVHTFTDLHKMGTPPFTQHWPFPRPTDWDEDITNSTALRARLVAHARACETEAQFVRGAAHAGLVLAPRYAEGWPVQHPAGYYVGLERLWDESATLRPVHTVAPDCALSLLRRDHWVNTPEARADAAQAWQELRENRVSEVAGAPPVPENYAGIWEDAK